MRAVVALAWALGMSGWPVPGSAAPFAYITNQGSDDVSVIDLASDRVVATVPRGHSPAGVVAASRAGKVFVSNPGDGTLSVIDMRLQRVVGSLPAGFGAFIGEPAGL